MKAVLCSLILLMSFNASAQYGYKDEKIASRFKPGFMWFSTGMRPGKDDKSRKYDRLVFDFFYTQANGELPAQTTRGSFGWNANTMWDVPVTKGNTFSIGWGFSYRHTRTGYNHILVQNTEKQQTTVSDYGALFTPDKQVLGSHSIAIPLELRFRAEKWKHLKFHLGGYAGYQFQTYNKIWTKHNQQIFKDKNLINSNPLVYGVHARLGFRNLALFADYRLSNFFESKESVQVNLLSFGLSVSLF
jgi:hypothetical protein